MMADSRHRHNNSVVDATIQSGDGTTEGITTEINFSNFVSEWNIKLTAAKKSVDEYELNLHKAIKSPPSNLRAEFETLDAIHKLDAMSFDAVSLSSINSSSEGTDEKHMAMTQAEIDYNDRFNTIHQLDAKLTNLICNEELEEACITFIHLVDIIVKPFQNITSDSDHQDTKYEGDEEVITEPIVPSNDIKSGFNKVDHLTFQSREALLIHIKPLKYLIDLKLKSFLIEVSWPKSDGVSFRYRRPFGGPAFIPMPGTVPSTADIDTDVPNSITPNATTFTSDLRSTIETKREENEEADEFKHYCLLSLRLQCALIKMNSMGRTKRYMLSFRPESIWLIDTLLSSVVERFAYHFYGGDALKEKKESSNKEDNGDNESGHKNMNTPSTRPKWHFSWLLRCAKSAQYFLTHDIQQMFLLTTIPLPPLTIESSLSVFQPFNQNVDTVNSSNELFQKNKDDFTMSSCSAFHYFIQGLVVLARQEVNRCLSIKTVNTSMQPSSSISLDSAPSHISVTPDMNSSIASGGGDGGIHRSGGGNSEKWSSSFLSHVMDECVLFDRQLEDQYQYFSIASTTVDGRGNYPLKLVSCCDIVSSSQYNFIQSWLLCDRKAVELKFIALISHKTAWKQNEWFIPTQSQDRNNLTTKLYFRPLNIFIQFVSLFHSIFDRYQFISDKTYQNYLLVHIQEPLLNQFVKLIEKRQAKLSGGFTHQNWCEFCKNLEVYHCINNILEEFSSDLSFIQSDEEMVENEHEFSFNLSQQDSLTQQKFEITPNQSSSLSSTHRHHQGTTQNISNVSSTSLFTTFTHMNNNNYTSNKKLVMFANIKAQINQNISELLTSCVIILKKRFLHLTYGYIPFLVQSANPNYDYDISTHFITFLLWFEETYLKIASQNLGSNSFSILFNKSIKSINDLFHDILEKKQIKSYKSGYQFYIDIRATVDVCQKVTQKSMSYSSYRSSGDGITNVHAIFSHILEVSQLLAISDSKFDSLLSICEEMMSSSTSHQRFALKEKHDDEPHKVKLKHNLRNKLSQFNKSLRNTNNEDSQNRKQGNEDEDDTTAEGHIEGILSSFGITELKAKEAIKIIRMRSYNQ